MQKYRGEQRFTLLAVTRAEENIAIERVAILGHELIISQIGQGGGATATEARANQRGSTILLSALEACKSPRRRVGAGLLASGFVRVAPSW